MTSEAHDEVKLDHSGRERGAWVYLDEFTLERAGIALNASEDVYAKRTGCRVGTRAWVILALTVRPRVLSPRPPFDADAALTAWCVEEGWV
jgi:hypothetical protein